MMAPGGTQDQIINEQEEVDIGEGDAVKNTEEDDAAKMVEENPVEENLVEENPVEENPVE